MSSPFVWFHHNGKSPNKTKSFLESLLLRSSTNGGRSRAIVRSRQKPRLEATSTR